MSIKVEGLTKIYGEQRAVDSISFEARKGEIVGFLGPNGAGKSTTMKIITGYLPATSGKAVVCGMDVREKPLEVRQRIGYLAESNPLYHDMYVREYLLFSAGLHGITKGKEERVAEMIRTTGLTPESHKKIGALSKGYKQRVGLAQAMLHNPDVLVLDEPTSGLDPNQLEEIRNLILSLGAEKTVLLSTHIMQEVQALCSRVVVINKGTIVADDKIENLQKEGGGGAVTVQFEKPVAEAKLKGLAGVKKVEHLGGNGYRLHTASPDALRRTLMQWAVAEDVAINALQAGTQSLEEVFRSLTKGK